jgi:type I restriction enzyme, S subunit
MLQLLSPLGRRQIERDARGSSETMPKIAQRHIRSWRVVAPPVEEQLGIVDGIKQATKSIHDAMKQAQTEISLLLEYRTRLIADVVTGKLDVRDAVTALPEEVIDAAAEGEGDVSDAELEPEAEPAAA